MGVRYSYTLDWSMSKGSLPGTSPYFNTHPFNLYSPIPIKANKIEKTRLHAVGSPVRVLLFKDSIILFTHLSVRFMASHFQTIHATGTVAAILSSYRSKCNLLKRSSRTFEAEGDRYLDPYNYKPYIYIDLYSAEYTLHPGISKSSALQCFKGLTSNQPLFY